jgi:hypothetical protein
VGRPWLSGGRGPEAFDCWGLVRWIVHEELHRDWLPEYQILPEQRPQVISAMTQAEVSGEWRRLATPRDGAAVGLSKVRHKTQHVGLFAAVDGGLVLHATEFGVLAQSLSRLQMEGWTYINFYWHNTWT